MTPPCRQCVDLTAKAARLQVLADSRAVELVSQRDELKQRREELSNVRAELAEARAYAASLERKINP